jgi:hypothetical protein
MVVYGSDHYVAHVRHQVDIFANISLITRKNRAWIYQCGLISRYFLNLSDIV